MNQLNELIDINNKPKVGSCEAMQPWLSRLDEICQQLEDKIDEIKNEIKRD